MLLLFNASDMTIPLNTVLEDGIEILSPKHPSIQGNDSVEKVSNSFNRKIPVIDNGILSAINFFWTTRKNQTDKQIKDGKIDAGSRGAVTGGKQLDGFLDIFISIARECGVPEKCIHTKMNSLPGFFRPTKDWDLIIMSPIGKLIACLELKSQVGSFGNNFNNRTEEALGNAVDIWTAYREHVFPAQQPPFVGYLMIVEDSLKSSTVVRLSKAHFAIRSEFLDTSYLDRYRLFCQKLMTERWYSATGLLYTSQNMSYRDPDGAEEISIGTFTRSFRNHIIGQLTEFRDLS